MRKRIWSFLLALGAVCVLCACGRGAKGADPAEGKGLAEEENQAGDESHVLGWQEQYDLGVRYLSEGKYEEAILAFTAVIEIDPKRAEGYLALSDVYIRQGDREAGRAVLEQGLEAAGDGEARARLEEQLREIAGEDGGEDRQEDSETDVSEGGEALPDLAAYTVLYEAAPEGGRPGLTVRIGDSRTGAVTLSGISVQDTYTTNLDTSPESIGEYGWKVDMYGEQSPIGVGSTFWAWEPGRNEETPLTEFQHNLWGIDEEKLTEDDPDLEFHKREPFSYIVPVQISYTPDSITWYFTVPEEYEFNFSKVNRCVVSIQDVRVEEGSMSRWEFEP